MSRSPSLPRLVVVEDNVETNNLLRDWLKTQFDVVGFLDAESTLRLLPPSSEATIFLIDYNMPGDNGIVLKGKLVPLFPGAKYILISGLFDERLTEEAKKAGFDGLLPKPFGMTAVLQKITELMGVGPEDGLLSLFRRHTSRVVNLL